MVSQEVYETTQIKEKTENHNFKHNQETWLIEMLPLSWK